MSTQEDDKSPFVPADELKQSYEQSDENETGPTVSEAGYGSICSPEQSVEIRNYKTRWWVLMIFCFVGFTNFVVWNTFGPIQNSAKFVYGWDNGMIALMADWGLVTLIVLPPFYVVIMKNYGLRVAELITVACMCAGTGVRLIEPSSQLGTTVIINIGQCLNGAGGIVPMAGAPLLSMTWFPENERRTATAFAAGTQQMGIALSFLIGPFIVDEPRMVPLVNGTPIENGTITVAPDNQREIIHRQIRGYMYGQFGVVLLLTLCVIVYFPKAPKQPPSAVSVSVRDELGPSIKQIVKMKKFWSLALTYGFFSGFFNSYLSVLAVDLAPIGFNQFLSGWLGFATTLIGATAGMFICNISDRFRHLNPIKKVLTFLLFMGLISFSCFVFVAKSSAGEGLSSSASNGLIFTTVMITGAASASSVPLIFEMGPDILYPIGEEVIGSMLVLVQNCFGLVILLVFLIPNIGTAWLDYTVLAGIACAIPMILLTDDTNVRSKAQQHYSTINEST